MPTTGNTQDVQDVDKSPWFGYFPRTVAYILGGWSLGLWYASLVVLPPSQLTSSADVSLSARTIKEVSMRKLILTLIVSMALGTVALVSRQFVPRSAASAPPTVQHPSHPCDACTDDAKKVTICHVAPGSGNEETITISCHALNAHLSNHPDDYCGPCNGHTQH